MQGDENSNDGFSLLSGDATTMPPEDHDDVFAVELCNENCSTLVYAMQSTPQPHLQHHHQRFIHSHSRHPSATPLHLDGHRASQEYMTDNTTPCTLAPATLTHRTEFPPYKQPIFVPRKQVTVWMPPGRFSMLVTK